MNPVPDTGESTYQGSGRLTGRKAIVTGADSGIGRAVAIALWVVRDSLRRWLQPMYSWIVRNRAMSVAKPYY